MKIRNARHEDVDNLVYFMSELGYPSSNEIIEENLSAYGSTDGYEVLVAEHEGKILGCISLHVIKLFHLEGNIGRITSLVVSPNNRGKGVGKALIEAADTFFKKMGCVRAEVTSADYRQGAHIFYQSHGYVLDSRRFIKHF